MKPAFLVSSTVLPALESLLGRFAEVSTHGVVLGTGYKPLAYENENRMNSFVKSYRKPPHTIIIIIKCMIALVLVYHTQ